MKIRKNTGSSNNRRSRGRPSTAVQNRRDSASISLPRWQWDALNDIVRKFEGLSRSQIISDAVELWLKGGNK